MNKNPPTVIPAKAGILQIPHPDFAKATPGEARASQDDKNMDKNTVSFQCIHCNKQITAQQSIGTLHQNHCPYCLWSQHVDDQKPGDRKSTCQAAMKPVGLTFKQEGVDKYGKQKQGEIMLIHMCSLCGKININRIAGDDDASTIMSLLDTSLLSHEILTQIQKQDIHILDTTHTEEVQRQLFGVAKI